MAGSGFRGEKTIDKWFSNYIHQNHPESFVKQSPEFHPIRSSNSVGLGEDLECSFQKSSQMRWRLLIQGPHWETTALVVLGQDSGIGCF